jgi:ABC-type multidrug transport system ATPase subunit
MVRLRRSREHGRVRRELEQAVAPARRELDTRTIELATGRSEVERHRVIARTRALRIHQHAHQRLSAYRRTLVRTHPNGAWVSQTMDSLQPELPGWAVQDGEPATAPAPVQPLPPPGDDAASPGWPIDIGPVTRFGSAPERVDVVIEGQYGVAPMHATLTRLRDRFRLQDHGTGDGTFVDGRPVRSIELTIGAAYTIGDQQYRIVAEDLLEETGLARCDLVVAGLNAADRKKGWQRLTAMSFLQPSRTLVAILGPSGAGKSSLFSALLGELDLGDGRVFFRDLNLRSHGPQLRTKLGYVPQKDDSIYHSLTVGRLLTYSDRLRRPTASRSRRNRDIARVCRQLGIDRNLGQEVRSLSGGERRRVSIALEILAEPDLLMLDEPTSGLDPAMDREVMTILRDLSRTGRAVIAVTHSTEHLHLADQVLIVASQGRPVYSGPPGEALDALAAGSYANLMAALKADPRPAAEAYQRGDVARKAKARATELENRPDPATDADLPRPLGRLRRQLPVLVQRQIALMCTRAPVRQQEPLAAARGLAVIGAPLLVAAATAYLAARVTGAGGLGGPTIQTAISLLVTVCMLSGQALSYGDVVSEFPIVRREYRTGIGAAAVLLAKWSVFAAVAAVQAGIVTAVFLAAQEGSSTSVLLPPAVEMFVGLAALSVTAMTLGLLISVIAVRLEQAVVLATAAAIGQVALNGGLTDLTTTSPALQAFALLLPSRWGFAAVAASTDVRAVSPAAPADALWAHSTGRWFAALGALVLLTVAFGLAAVGWLARRLRSADT